MAQEGTGLIILHIAVLVADLVQSLLHPIRTVRRVILSDECLKGDRAEQGWLAGSRLEKESRETSLGLLSKGRSCPRNEGQSVERTASAGLWEGTILPRSLGPVLRICPGLPPSTVVQAN